ncbi:MAG: hypothetical protein Aureis2KO_00500 [Aureisphaera sp.]
MRKQRRITLSAFCFLLTFTVYGQWEYRKIITNDNITYPETSKLAQITNTIGITEISIKYHRPAVRNRIIFGTLIPYGSVWRAGANESTTISFQDDVTINGQPLESGIYGLHIIPNKDEWTIIFSKNNTQWGSFYFDESEDALRVSVVPENSEHQEYLKYDFRTISDNSTHITLTWADTKVTFTVAVDEVATTLAVIEDELRTLPRFSWRGNREAAFYLWLHDIHLDKALKMVDRSISYERRFENVYQKALILESLGSTVEAEKLFNEAKALGNERMYLYVGREALGHHNSAEKAITLFEKALKYYPNSFQAMMLKGRVYGWMGKFDEAIRHFNKALVLAQTQKDKDRVQSERNVFKQ